MRQSNTVDAFDRSAHMSKIRGRDTRPELALRAALHARGLRFRANDRRLPGTPDLVFPRYRAAVFVHGCFWHGHDCPLGAIPSTRREFWLDKFARNRARDARVRVELEEAGWRVLEVFECSWRGQAAGAHQDVVDAVERWLEGDEPSMRELRGPHPAPPSSWVAHRYCPPCIRSARHE
jgi:DNA mismatch endonuclease (patch repair protein)